jgi:hypothetical protein
MPIQKQYTVKIFDQDGTTFLKNLTSDRPANLDLPYLKNVPSFKSLINGGFGECVLDLAFPFDDFEEGTTIDFMNIVKIYAVKTDIETLEQTVDLIYTGYMSKYDPYIEPGAEGVRVTCLGLVSILNASYYKNGSSFTVTHSTQDPEAIGRAIVDHVNTIYGGSLFSYSNDTTDAVGTNVSIEFTDARWSDALKKAGELAGEGWWWKIDEQGQYWLKETPATPTHTFTIGKDIERLHGEKDGEKVINDVFVRRNGGTETSYDDATSQAEFGTGSPATSKRTRIITDSSLTDANAADQRGNKELDDNKVAKVRSPFTVNMNYDLESIKVGGTCKITNLKNGNTFFGDNMLIVGLTYRGETVDVELEDAAGSFANELVRFVQEHSPTE